MKVGVLRGSVDAATAVREMPDVEALITIDADGAARTDHAGWTVEYLDAGSSECVLVECFERIKDAWERAHQDSERHLGHAITGMWFFYWLTPSLVSMATLAREGRVEDLRGEAAAFIESRFGEVVSRSAV